jgi:Zn-dependent M16 (insulinase) family peptidase
MSQSRIPHVPFAVGHVEAGFHVDRVEPLPEIRAVAIQGEHAKSGARWLHLYTESDTENCFCVTFPTPPSDDTGLPHIMEHAVLGGSRKFPVREPFFEMLKMSMATFINAMTSQAYTTYPIATNVKKDFFNLATVYLDAVFHPELKEETFRREGHHLALENNADLTSALKISGIVYNEMKGAYSAPESLLVKMASRGLFPDIPLGRDSGGDPESIPQLTYEQFCAFHRDRYHPSNALIFSYGDIPTGELLRFLQPVLDEFERRPLTSELMRQPRWAAPRTLEEGYPIGKSEEAEGRAFCVLNWLVGDALDPDEATAWEVLGQILAGNDGAPLKKALIDSKLGADVVFTGAGAWAQELCFHAGLKGTERERSGPFEKLVLDTLRDLAGKPFGREQVDAAFQQLAYDRLEVKTLFPMHLLSAVNSAWPYGADPLIHLRMRQSLDSCRQRYAANPRMFNQMMWCCTPTARHRPEPTRLSLTR